MTKATKGGITRIYGFIFYEGVDVMKKLFPFAVILLLLFTGCTVESRLLQSSTLSTAPESATADDSKDTGVFLDAYVETFPEYKFEGKSEATFGDRHFGLAVSPQNIPEELVANNYYYDIAGEFEKLSAIYGGNQALKLSATNTEKKFNEGAYIKEYVIKELAVVKKAELENGVSAITFSLEKDIASYSLTEFTVIRAKLSMLHSEASLSRGQQLSDGDYIRSFLCGKRENSDEWKIYEVYWE